MRRRRVVCVVACISVALWLAACANSASPLPLPTIAATAAPPVSPAPTSTPDPSAHKNALGGFPFPAGTAWVYSRVEYQQVIGDPTSIITATNLITETVVRTQSNGPFREFLHKQTASLVSAPPGWEDHSSNFNWERWYHVDGHRILSSPEGFRQITTVIYDFPLFMDKNWCPEDPPPTYNPHCNSMGRRTVESRMSYTTRIGTFDECYEIGEEFNSGGVREWFCNGIGIVARKYDHAGSRFGFEDMLISYLWGPSRQG